MGVSSTTNTMIYNGDGVTTSFPFPFYFFQFADLFLYSYDTVAGSITAQVLGVNYNILGVPNAQGLYPSGGNAVFVAAPLATAKIVISRFPIEQQNYALLQNGLISSTALVQEMDYLTLLIQSLQDQVNRCLQLPPGFAPTFNPDLPSDTALFPNYGIGINPTGDGLVVTPFGPGGLPGPPGPAGPAGSSGVSVVPENASVVLVAGAPPNGQAIPCNAVVAPFTVTLPVANLAAVGQVFHIKKIDATANVVTILANGADLILGTSYVASLALDYQGKSFSLVCRAVGFWDLF